jgi:RNA polymerase sigma factor (sigma-70 family)
MDPSKKELAELIEGCKKGDRTSQKEVFERFQPQLMGSCLRYTKDQDRAKDILQEAFIKIFSNIGKFEDTGSFEGWMRRVVVNTAIDHLRKKKNDHVFMGEENSPEEHRDEQLDEEEDVKEEEEFKQAKAQEIIEALQELSPGYRAVFNLYVVENYSHKEIAEMLDINIGTSKSNLAKAKRNLKEILAKKESDER